jgi:ubiquinone/menaquinone biosynthesis C-methylase UbiE
LWNAASDNYEERHAHDLSGDKAMAWGLWRIPEFELQILGDAANKDVLELGCGAARWAIALAQKGARVTGLDLSPRQLFHAHKLIEETGVSLPLVEASAESIPLPDDAFDIVFCDWGAMTFADPERTVPEVARVLRPGGLFAFANSTPLQFVCRNLETDLMEERLVNDYFGMKKFEWEDEVNFQLTYGDWIRLFVRNRLEVEDLIETQPAAGIESSYREPEEVRWARRWPMEVIWRLRKRA